MTPVAQQQFATQPIRQSPPNMVKRFLDYLFVECGLSANTITAYRADLCEFWTDSCPDNHWPEDLDILAVQTHMMNLHKRGLCTASIARHLAAIKMFLRYQHQSGLLRRDVASIIELPKKWRYLPDSFHADEIQRLLEAPLPTDEYYDRDKALLELLYATGLRASEVASLTLNQLNLRIGYLRCMGKGNKERIVPIGRPAIKAVNNYIDCFRRAVETSKSENSLFLSRTGRPLDRSNVWRLVRKYALRAGIKNLHTHSLRHSFATHMVDGGANIRIVQELLGHADPSTTQVYVHVTEKRLKDVHRRFHPRQ